MTHEQNKDSFSSSKKENEVHNLVLFNDELNSFDYVIETLVEVCNHDFEQAEQCATITHYKGKCAVKKGSTKDLLKMQEEIIERGLSAIIE